MGYEGFSGNESILYHLHSPCRIAEVGAFAPIVREEWVPDAHVHRLADINPVAAGGDPLSGRRLLMFNADVEVSIVKPTEPATASTATAKGTSCSTSTAAAGALRTVFGRLPFRERDYVVIPRGTTHHVGARRQAPSRSGCASTLRARSRRRSATATATASCSSTPRSRSATSTPRRELETFDESGSSR